MATPLEQLQQETGRTFAALMAARERTDARILERRALLDDLAIDADATIVLMGSWGRHELTSSSDDDYMVLVRGTPGERPPSPTVEQVATRFAQDPRGFSAPGQEGIFANVVFSTDLLEKIGLDDDTNTNLTRRMLLLLESLAACHPGVLAGARRDVIDDYLRDSVKDFRPPRFLLNDVVRYWRTIGVDFVAKVRKRDGQGWGLRNAKLRTSRKLLFASGLLPILRCHELTAAEIPDFLAAQFALPPTDRVADAFLRYGALVEGAATFGAYDAFTQLIDDAEVRTELDAIVGRAAADASERFGQIARLGSALDRGLISLLYGPALAATTQRYGIF
jgi:hypothetical protein